MFVTVIVYVTVPPLTTEVTFVVFVIDKSALAGASATAFALFAASPLSGSDVDDDALALFVTAPLVELLATITTSVKFAVDPFARLAFVHVIVPLAPIAGVVHVKPDGFAIDWNSSDAGKTSVIVAFAAASGPELCNEIVYVIVELAGALDAFVVFVIERSALSGVVYCVSASSELLAGVGSFVVLEIVNVC